MRISIRPIIVAASVMFASLSLSIAAENTTIHADNLGYIVVTNFIDAQNAKGDESLDLASVLQKLIDENPNRTLFFPDGEYILSHPIYTPADPRRSVSLKLSEFAVLKAGSPSAASDKPSKTSSSKAWSGSWAGEAVVQLGAIHPANDIHTNGSNYSIEGGIVDGSGVAYGISINGGRETAVRNVSIKHTVVGLHIKRGANSGSSDADITGVNIVGTGKKDSVGILLEGYDNTLTNIRIGNVFTGVWLRSGGNVLRNIHPLYYSGFGADYKDSTGFLSESQDNWYDYCYSDQFAIGFRMSGNGVGFYNDCFCYWYTWKGNTQTAFKADQKFNAIVTNFRAGFRQAPADSAAAMQYRVLTVGEAGGKGTIDNLVVDDESLLTDDTYQDYLDGKARKKS